MCVCTVCVHTLCVRTVCVCAACVLTACTCTVWVSLYVVFTADLQSLVVQEEQGLQDNILLVDVTLTIQILLPTPNTHTLTNTHTHTHTHTLSHTHALLPTRTLTHTYTNAAMPVEPRLAKCLLSSLTQGCSEEMLSIAAMCSVEYPHTTVRTVHRVERSLQYDIFV